jgi:signal transduction histidine kinase
VTASNNDGLWNRTGASVSFSIAPTFYQRKLFWAACVVLALGVARLLYLLRVRQLQERIRLRLEATAAERERIARDLHDTLLQGVQGLIYQMSAITERLPGADPQRSEMGDALNRAEAMLVDGRDRVTGLRRQPDPDATLIEALGSVARELTARSASRYSASVLGEPRVLRGDVGEELYRIGAEALVNAFMHAAASEVEVELRYDRDAFLLSVRDNGRGFDGDALQSVRRPGHFGLLGIQERARRIGGELQIWSRDGAGTEITCRLGASAAYPQDTGSRARAWIDRFWTNPARD